MSRALTLLDRLARGREPMTMARLANELALPKSTVHGLCNTLMSFGYLRRQNDGSFVIGPRVMGLAEAFIAGTNVAREFDALWADAGIATDETLLLSVLSGTEVIYVSARNGVRPLGLAFTVGMRLPAHLAATGKAMLSYQPVEAVRALFGEQPLPALTAKGPRTVPDLLRELEATRQRGWSIDDETVREGVYAIGAPVFDASGRAVAGIGVCINRALVDTDHGHRQREAVLTAARLLSQRLGGRAPDVPVAPGATDAPSEARAPARRRPSTKAGS